MHRRVLGALLSALLIAAALVSVGSGPATAACPVGGCPGGPGGGSGAGYVHVTTSAPYSSGTATLPVVTDDQGQISCGADCTGSYPWSCDEYGICSYTPVTLSASGGTGWRVAFSGCDTNGTTCQVDEPSSTSTDPLQVTASFTDVQAPSIGFVSPPVVGSLVSHPRLTVSLADNDKVKRLTWSHQATGGPWVTDAVLTDPGSTSMQAFTVPDGRYTFQARADDYTGNVHSVSIYLTVDSTPPSLTVTGGPDEGAPVSAPPVFRFAAEDGVTVGCAVDGATWRYCSGEAEDALPALPEGPHTWEVAAWDDAGNTTQLLRHFTVDTTPPGLTVDSGPADGATVKATSVAYGFTADDGASVACALDTGAYRSCSGPTTDELTHLANGTHTWRVRATDAAGNATVRTRGFTVSVPVPHIRTGVQHRWSVRRGHTKVLVLRTGKLPAGARVVVSCKGAHRPFGRRTLRPSARHVVDLRGVFRRPLAPGVTVTVAMVRHGYIGRAFRFTTRRHALPAYRMLTLPQS